MSLNMILEKCIIRTQCVGCPSESRTGDFHSSRLPTIYSSRTWSIIKFDWLGLVLYYSKRTALLTVPTKFVSWMVGPTSQQFRYAHKMCYFCFSFLLYPTVDWIHSQFVEIFASFLSSLTFISCHTWCAKKFNWIWK